MESNFRLWVEDLEEHKPLINLSGKIYPIIHAKIGTELTKNSRTLAKEVGSAFCNAYQGHSQTPGSIKNLWEIHFSSTPLEINGKRIGLGSVIMGYQFPAEARGGRTMTPDECEKFMKSRLKTFEDFFRALSKDPRFIEALVNEIVVLVHQHLNGKNGVKPHEAHSIWEKKVTINGGARDMGRIVMAYRPAITGGDIETSHPSATDSIAKT